MTEYRENGQIFWSELAANSAVKAIQFAIEEIDDHYDRLDFLKRWNEGDLKDWPEFFRYINKETTK